MLQQLSNIVRSGFASAISVVAFSAGERAALTVQSAAQGALVHRVTRICAYSTVAVHNRVGSFR